MKIHDNYGSLPQPGREASQDIETLLLCGLCVRFSSTRKMGEMRIYLLPISKSRIFYLSAVNKNGYPEWPGIRCKARHMQSFL